MLVLPMKIPRPQKMGYFGKIAEFLSNAKTAQSAQKQQ